MSDEEREDYCHEVETKTTRELSVNGESKYYTSEADKHIRLIIGKSGILSSYCPYHPSEVEINFFMDDRLDSTVYITPKQGYMIGEFLLNWAIKELGIEIEEEGE